MEEQALNNPQAILIPVFLIQAQPAKIMCDFVLNLLSPPPLHTVRALPIKASSRHSEFTRNVKALKLKESRNKIKIKSIKFKIIFVTFSNITAEIKALPRSMYLSSFV